MQMPVGGNGAFQANPRPLRHRSDLDAQVQLRRVGDLLAEVGRILSEIQLDVPAEPGLMDDMKRPRLMSADDVGELLQVDAKTVRRWGRAGRIPRAIEVGGVCRWRPEDIDRWIQEQGR